MQIFIVQPGIQSAAVLAQVGDGGGFAGKQVAQRQGVLQQVSDDAAHAVRQAGARQWPVAPVFSRGQVTELVGIENAADVTVWQGLALHHCLNCQEESTMCTSMVMLCAPLLRLP